MRTRAARIDGDTPATTAAAESAVARRVRMARATAPAAPVVRSAADPTGGAPSAADLNVTISSLDVMEGRRDGRIWWGIPSRLRARNASSAAGRRKTRFVAGAPGSSRPLACGAGSAELLVTVTVPVRAPLRGIHPVGLASPPQRARVSTSRVTRPASTAGFKRVIPRHPRSCLFGGGSGNIESKVRMHDSRYRRFAAALGIVGAAVGLSCGESPTSSTSFGAPAALQIVTGGAQIGAAGQALPDPLTVQVLDAAGHGLRGHTVTWTVQGGGTLFARAIPTVTDSTGLVLVFWQLGPVLGAQGVIAHCCGLDAAFSAQAQLPLSQRVQLYTGGGQQGTVEAPLTYPLVIQVLKADGTFDTGVPVEWRAISRGSSYSPANTQTDS